MSVAIPVFVLIILREDLLFQCTNVFRFLRLEIDYRSVSGNSPLCFNHLGCYSHLVENPGDETKT